MDENGRIPARPHLPTRPRTAAGAEAIAELEALGESVHEADDEALRKLDLRSTDALALQLADEDLPCYL